MLILAWGILPPLALLAYIWWLDRVEHEPVSLVAKALLFGAISVVYALVLELLGENIISLLPLAGVGAAFVDCFFVVALAEESGKRFAMKFAVWKSKEFNYTFDAIVYCVAAALGFAIVENITYMCVDGVGSALGRLIPVHSICGVFMGASLGLAKMHELQGRAKAARLAHAQSLLVPVLIHGSYDFCLTVDNDYLAGAALLGVLVLTIFTFLYLRKMAKRDKRLMPLAQQIDSSFDQGIPAENRAVPVVPVAAAEPAVSAVPAAPVVPAVPEAPIAAAKPAISAAPVAPAVAAKPTAPVASVDSDAFKDPLEPAALDMPHTPRFFE